ncbi:DUF2537 domain-containing protein [Gordonia sp. ABSL1-1]|uniref:DUF2537 domain-containing protein n=1 Tax=Gordonia sp. ABSL1-1 TaxID=3053923 RepID=UPI002572F195|nr:DUF2537 domain-containing protein [Gordonia sp. ABSL1-1]MDL9937769.1 DUF2537 domain-containing protein [Gordonia sp. ABSL1-1]
MTAPPPAAEPTPWGPGLVVAVCCGIFAALVLVGVFDLVAGASVWLALAAVVAVCGGLGWTLWDLRTRAVWRWIVAGLLLGMAAGLIASVSLLIVGV